MTARERANRQTAYRKTAYVQGNAVRKLQTLPKVQEPAKKVSHTTRKNRERALHMNVGYVLFLAAAMVAAGFILTGYLTLQSDITNSVKNISKLESRLNYMRLENDENYNRITSSINLEEVRRIAIQELGMRYAEEGQIITFNGESNDYVRQTGEIPD